VLRLSNKAGGGQGGGIPCSILVSVVSVFSDSCSGRSGCSGGFVPVVSGFSTCRFWGWFGFEVVRLLYKWSQSANVLF
jgi:hypothetical protein